MHSCASEAKASTVDWKGGLTSLGWMKGGSQDSLHSPHDRRVELFQDPRVAGGVNSPQAVAKLWEGKSAPEEGALQVGVVQGVKTVQ